MKVGGDQGTALIFGKPKESLMIQRIELGEMPPKEGKGLKAVASADLLKLKEWISEGAKWPANRALGIHEKKVDLKVARDFWSFQKVKRPAVPIVMNPYRNESLPSFESD